MAMHGVALMNAGYGKYTYPPDRTSDPRVKAYVDHQEQLRVKLLEHLRQSGQFKSFTSDEQVWTNYEYMEVFDQLAVCLQSLSVEQQMAQARSYKHAERRRRTHKAR
jgi:hypothetical protein